MSFVRAERLHVQAGQRVVRDHVEAGARVEPLQALPRSEYGDRAAKPPRVEDLGGRVAVGLVHAREGTTIRRGGRYRVRTDDVLRVKQVLYQLS